MGSHLSNTANITQQFYNNITQDNEQNCIIDTSSVQSGNVVIISGATTSGDVIGANNTVQTDATCLMTSTMQDTVANTMKSTLAQENKSETDMFNGFQIPDDSNDFNVNQTITNNINQINQATCSINTVTSSTNNYIYITDVNAKEVIGINSNTVANANCTITNQMKNSTYNSAQSSASQSNVDLGMFAQAMGLFTAIAAMIVIAVVVIFLASAFGVTKKATGTAAVAPIATPSLEEQLLQLELTK